MTAEQGNFGKAQLVGGNGRKLGVEIVGGGELGAGHVLDVQVVGPHHLTEKLRCGFQDRFGAVRLNCDRPA